MSNQKRIVVTVLCSLLILSACTKENVSQMDAPSSPPAAEEAQLTAMPTLSPTAAAEVTLITDPGMVVQNYEQAAADFNQNLKTTDWIRYVYQIVYYNNVTKEYQDPQTKEEWYRFDAEGKLVEAYNWLSTATGEIQQEAFYYDGSFFNVDNDAAKLDENSRPREKNDQVDFTGNFAEELRNGEKQTQEAIPYQGAEAWRFSYEIKEGGVRTMEAIYFNRDTGLMAGKETYVVAEDGSMKLVSGVITSDFEIATDPPTQHFQDILARAQAQQIGPYAQ
jgi:hypothetical protein